MTVEFESYQPIFSGSLKYTVEFGGMLGAPVQDVSASIIAFLQSLPGYAPGSILVATFNSFEWVLPSALSDFNNDFNIDFGK